VKCDFRIGVLVDNFGNANGLCQGLVSRAESNSCGSSGRDSRSVQENSRGFSVQGILVNSVS